MAQVVITINKREYAIACENGQEIQIIKLARILDEKASMLVGALGHINETQLLAMIGLLMADELMETKKKLEKVLSEQNEEPKVVAPAVSSKSGEDISLQDIKNLDENFSSALKTLSEMIKSVALNLK